MRHSHAATDRNIEAGQFAVLDDCDESEILRVHVDVILRRHNERRLELAWQIRRAVNWFDFILWRFDLVAIQPDFMVGARRRGQVRAHRLGELLHLGMN